MATFIASLSDEVSSDDELSEPSPITSTLIPSPEAITFELLSLELFSFEEQPAKETTTKTAAANKDINFLKFILNPPVLLNFNNNAVKHLLLNTN